MENNENRGIVIQDDSLENALTRASELLHIDRARVSYRVIESGSNGILGLFGKKKLVIRAWADELIPTDILKSPAPREASAPAEEREPRSNRGSGRDREPRRNREPRREREQRSNREPRHRRETSPKDDRPRTPEAPDPSLQNDPNIQKAKEFLSGLLERMGSADSTITEHRIEEGILLNISSDTEGMLIGRKGQTLDALQYLLNRYTAGPSGLDEKIILDVENYRDRREARIKKMAQDLAKKAKKTGKPVAAQPMGSSERRIFHLALKNDSDLSTESKGRGEKRKVIVYPKKSDKNRS